MNEMLPTYLLIDISQPNTAPGIYDALSPRNRPRLPGNTGNLRVIPTFSVLLYADLATS